MRTSYVQHRGYGCDRKCYRLHYTYVHCSRKFDEDKESKEGTPPARASVDMGGHLPVALLPGCPLQGKEEDCGTHRRGYGGLRGVSPTLLCSARGTASLRGKRRTGPRRSGLPGSSSLRWRRVNRWRAGQGQWQARRRQGNGAYAVPGAGMGSVREVSAVGRSLRSIRLPPGSGAEGRERRAALSSVALSPGAFQGVGRARRLARPTRQSTRLSPASVQPAERPMQLAALPAPALTGFQSLLIES